MQIFDKMKRSSNSSNKKFESPPNKYGKKSNSSSPARSKQTVHVRALRQLFVDESSSNAGQLKSKPIGVLVFNGFSIKERLKLTYPSSILVYFSGYAC